MPSLSELAANPPDSRLTHTLDVVLDFPLVRKIAELRAEFDELDGSKHPRDRARFAEVRAELDALAPEVEAKSGVLTLRANKTLGEWHRFTDKFPPRPKEHVAHKRDLELTGGRVDADAVIENLGDFVSKWDEEPLDRARFDGVIRDLLPPGDLRRCVAAIVMMYVESPNFSGWLNDLSSSLERSLDSGEPETSGSPLSDSPGGNPESSSEGSTSEGTPAV